MKIRLKDIAEATGFSINTVSHALRDEPDIPEATRKKIKATAKEMGYIPNAYASSFRSGKTRTVSVILPDIINPHFTIVFREIQQFFRSVGMTPFFMNTNENIEEELNAVKQSIGQNVAGVILCPTQVGTQSLALLESARMPFVLIGRHFDGEPDADSVVCDDFSGGYQATKHLLELGHKRIAYVRVSSIISSDKERFTGYKQALDESGVPFIEQLVLDLNLTGIENGRAIQNFLKSNPDCTAVLSFNDSLAYTIMREIKLLGMRVPEDISVIGFDNICSDFTFPTMLSSVSVSKKHMAQTASEVLYARIQESDQAVEKKHIVLPTKLFLRETTAKARK